MALITVPAVVGIAIGGSLGLFLVLTAAAYAVIRWRRQLNDRSGDEPELPASFPILSAASASSSRIFGQWDSRYSEDPWTSTPSAEGPACYATVKRLPRPHSLSSEPSVNRSVRPRSLGTTQLSAILEHPKSARTSNFGPGCKSLEGQDKSLVSSVPMSSSKTFPIGDRYNPLDNTSGPQTGASLRASEFTDWSRRLEVRKSAFGDPGFGSITDRSRSEPSILPALQDSLAVNTSRNELRRTLRQRSRSISLCSQNSGSAPHYPPPPLPLVPALNAHPEQSIKRSASESSISSLATSTSSILLNEITSPKMRARAEFSQRNPDVALGAQLRRGNLCLDDLLADNHASASRHHRKRNDFQRVNQCLPDLGARISTALQGTSAIHPALREARVDDHANLPAESLPLKPVNKQAHSRDPPRIDPFTGSTTRSTSPSSCGRLSHATSIAGSPAQRRRRSNHVGCGECEVQAAIGRTSILDEPLLTPRSSQNSPHWSSNYMSGKDVVMPSAMKGSPRAKTKMHRRQNTVRILIEPTELDHGLRSDSASSLPKISEGQYPTRQTWTATLEEGPGLYRIRSASQAAEAVRLGSPLSSLRNENKQSIGPADRQRQQRVQGIRPPVRNRSNSYDRQSTASSALTIPPFPDPLYGPDDSSCQTSPNGREVQTGACASENFDARTSAARLSLDTPSFSQGLTNPMDTKPILAPPGVLRSVQSLRRMDSERFDGLELEDDTQGRRQWTVTRSAEKTSSPSDPCQRRGFRRWMSESDEDEDTQSESGKENHYGDRRKAGPVLWKRQGPAANSQVEAPQPLRTKHMHLNKKVEKRMQQSSKRKDAHAEYDLEGFLVDDIS